MLRKILQFISPEREEIITDLACLERRIRAGFGIRWGAQKLGPRGSK